MRNLIFVRSAERQAWGCSECAWVFNPSGPPRGFTLDQMKENFERQRDKEFVAHVCAQHPRSRESRPRKAEDESQVPPRK